MKRLITLCLLLCAVTSGFAQTDSTRSTPDTIKIGGMIIIRDKDSKPEKEEDRGILRIRKRENNEEPSAISTNWWIIDIGFSNYNDRTDYASASTQAFAPGSNEDWFKLRAGKSRNINLWFFMQRISIAKRVLNLKYGVGLELNNYHFDESRIKFSKKPTLVALDESLKGARKNKLAADYLTVPVMLNINFTPGRQRGFGFSGGVSAGFLYSARQKTKNDGDVDKTKSDFNLDRWKLAYVGELLLGPVKLYGSYAFKNMWEKGLDQVPYTVGFRISSW
ncbi:MAG: outer membrane beta-barrel protein [Chitinophagaceae bacterium]|nr:outer membrane beta-barrel protein [Chitinophagaceae bacterium]